MKLSTETLKKYRVQILIIIFICILILPFIMASFSSYHAVIKNTGGEFYRAKALVILGNTLFCFREKETHRNRRAIKAMDDADYSPSFVSMKTISFIEIIPDPDEVLDIPAEYLGTYKVNVTGHEGYLFLVSKNGVLYGSIRFPRWAKGAYEPLKGVRISGGSIRFTRSVTSLQEMRRIGANSYFTQVYSGTYGRGGKTIKGFYIKDGAKSLWEAVKIR